MIRMLRKQVTEESYRYVFLDEDIHTRMSIIDFSDIEYACYECESTWRSQTITTIYGEFFHHSYCVMAARLDRGLFQRDIKIVMKSGGKIKT